MKSKFLLGFFIGFLLVGSIFLLVKNNFPKQTKFSNLQAVVYKSPTCGCCENYIGYLKNNGFQVKVINLDDRELEKFKIDQGVPPYLMSCHTTFLNNYLVEGHIPIEAIEKLLTEKPEIKGIALPGMPSGSPGMPGFKLSSFKIKIITKDNQDGGLFMEI
jgi:hypothetical protein